MDIDDPRVTELRKGIIRKKVFLRRIYEEWYANLASTIPSGPGAILEIGSGAGFLADYIPDLITSEIFHCAGIHSVLNAHDLPFAGGALRAIVMTDVFHHLPRPEKFLEEAARCVRPGGVLAMNEPWITTWSQWVYMHLHHEPCDPDAADWTFPPSGPLSGANSALPWIVFWRDRARFERAFPQWQVQQIRLHTPFRYLVSGGVSSYGLAPGWAFAAWCWLESLLLPWMNRLAMFSLIVLRRC